MCFDCFVLNFLYKANTSETLKKLVCLFKVSGPVGTAQWDNLGKSLTAIRDNNVLCVILGLSYTLKFLRKKIKFFSKFYFKIQ